MLPHTQQPHVMCPSNYIHKAFYSTVFFFFFNLHFIAPRAFKLLSEMLI